MSKPLFKLVLVCLGVVGLASILVGWFKPDQLAHIYFLDVGQGDAELIRTPNQHYILIDGGPDNSVVSQLGRVIPPWQRQIDLVILTHAHADHATGLLAVLDQYDVKQFWYTGAQYDSATYQELVDKLTQAKIPVQLANQGDYLSLDQTSLNVSFPLQERPTNTDPNETSVVNTFQYKNFTTLFTGDVYVNDEKKLVGVLPDVDVIKIPHHGSRTSSSQELINKTQPEVGVIEVGANNKFGHPAPDVLSRYQSAQTQIYRTDQDGMIEIITDGTRYRVLPTR